VLLHQVFGPIGPLDLVRNADVIAQQAGPLGDRQPLSGGRSATTLHAQAAFVDEAGDVVEVEIDDGIGGSADAVL